MAITFDRIPWGNSPGDATDERFYPIVRAGHQSPLYAQIISRQLVSCPTHWIDRSTMPCMGGREACDGCREGLHVRVKVYVLCMGRQTGKLGILEITPEAVRNCPRIKGERTDLRGLWVKVYRRSSYRNAPVVVEIAGETPADDVKVADEDIRPHLGRIWGMLPTKGIHRGNARKAAEARERGGLSW